jgi:hypothetical protein
MQINVLFLVTYIILFLMEIALLAFTVESKSIIGIILVVLLQCFNIFQIQKYAKKII